MLLAFACHTAASHAQVLERTAKSGHLVTLEVRHAHHHIGLGQCRAYLGLGAISAADVHYALIVATQAVGYDDVAIGSDAVETIDHSSVQMVDSIAAIAAIQRVAVGEERLATHLLQHSHYHCRIVGAYVCHVAILSEVYLDSHILVFHVEPFDACAAHHALQFLQQVGAFVGTQVGKIYF